MRKNIIILNGSPRAKGNTAALVQAFTEGAEQAGHNVTTFQLQQMQIGGCLGCFGGGKDPAHPCVQRDAMEQIYPCYQKADVVVLASPLYYWTISGQLKTAIDRLFAVSECNEDCATPKKDCVLLMTAEGGRFGEALSWYEHFAEYAGWNDLGSVLAAGIPHEQTMEGRQELAQARALGKSIG